MKSIMRLVGVMLTMTFLLAACGGGGGASGVSPGATSGAPFTVSAPIDPFNINLLVGETRTYMAGGGVEPYTVSSSSAAVEVSIAKGVITVKGVSAGTATLTWRDNAGAILSTRSTVSSTVPLFTTSPRNVQIGANQSSTFTIGGGTAPYTAKSSNGSIIATVNGTELAIAGGSSGTGDVVVTDTFGNTVVISVTVGTGLDLFTTAGLSVTVPVGRSSIYQVGGGSGSYLIASSNTSVATVGLLGDQFVINGVAGGQTTVEIRDTAGRASRINVTVGSDNALYTTAPPDMQLAIGATQSFLIGGGATPYTVSSSDVTVATATVTGTTLAIKGVGQGSAVIVVSEVNGANVRITVNVGTPPGPLFTTAAPAMTLGLNETNTFTIGGGTGPYQVASSNNASVTATVSGNRLTISSTGTGTSTPAQVVVTDAAGRRVTIDVNVGTSANLFTTAPGTITLATGTSASYGIAGGTGPYTATSGNTGVATVVVSGGTMTITGVSAGEAEISIRDARGAPVATRVTVNGGGTSVATNPAVLPAGATGNAGDTLTFTVTGGTAPYRVTITNPTIANVTPTTVTSVGGTFTAALLNAGATSILVTDAAGRTVAPITLTVQSAAVAIRLSPSELMISEDNSSAVTLNIYGGTGPYRVFSGNVILAPVTVAGSVVTVGATSRCITSTTPGATNDVTITVLDVNGAAATSLFRVKDNTVGGVGCN